MVVKLQRVVLAIQRLAVVLTDYIISSFLNTVNDSGALSCDHGADMTNVCFPAVSSSYSCAAHCIVGQQCTSTTF